MKKIFKLTAITALVFALASCGSTPKAEKEETTTPAPVVESTAPASVASEILVDDFEEGMFWEAVGTSWNDGDVSIGCDLTTDWGGESGTSLKCTVGTKGAEWEKGGFFTAPYEPNWTGLTKLKLKVNNPNEYDIGICPVLQCGEGWEDWNQFEMQTVPASSEAELVFEIPHKQYLNFVQRVIIYTWGTMPQETTFYIDDIYATN